MTFQVTINTQYSRQTDKIYVEAKTAAEAISKARRTARLEGWFDIRNDGRVTYKATKNF